MEGLTLSPKEQSRLHILNGVLERYSVQEANLHLVSSFSFIGEAESETDTAFAGSTTMKELDPTMNPQLGGVLN